MIRTAVVIFLLLSGGIVSAQNVSFAPIGSIPGPADLVRVQGEYAFIAAGKTLTIFDISNPAVPKREGAYAFPEEIWGFRLAGSRAYVGANFYGLGILDISDAAMPKLAGSFKTLGQAKIGDVFEKQVVLIDHMEGLVMLDVSNEADPAAAESFFLDGYARDVVTSGSMAYAVDSPSGLYVFDLSQPGALEPVGVLHAPHAPHFIEVSGKLVCGMGRGDLQVYDVSDPAAPVKAATFPTPGDGRRISLRGTRAYIADGEEGIQVVDLDEPSQPRLVGAYKTKSSARDVAAANGLVFVVVGEDEVLILKESAATFSDEEVQQLSEEVNLENWDDGGELSRFAFLSIPEIFQTEVIRRGSEITALGYELDDAIPSYEVGGSIFEEFVSAGALDGIVIVRGGKIVYESYPRMAADEQHILFSVGKVMVSTVIAMLEDLAKVTVTDPVETYVPALEGTAWEGITVLDVLDMASGIDAAEQIEDSYTNPARKHYQYEASLGWLPKVEALPASVVDEETYAFLMTLGRKAEPGTIWEYASVNTMLLAWIAEEVTGKKFADLFSELVWSKMGAEADALVSVNKNGHAAVHGGIVTTLRDVARFGLLFTNERDREIVSARYMGKILDGGRPEILEAAGRSAPDVKHATYQWDRVFTDGSFFKGGFGGQGLYVSPAKDIVLAYFGTHGYDAPEPPVLDVCREMFDEIY